MYIVLFLIHSFMRIFGFSWLISLTIYKFMGNLGGVLILIFLDFSYLPERRSAARPLSLANLVENLGNAF
jgi:hypothetical protein